ncbi:MAG: hypothetical protein KDK39_01590 [Leptospiraceae bacterium]|nr:hypothetical protein [Leptospiraceae bacterium]
MRFWGARIRATGLFAVLVLAGLQCSWMGEEVNSLVSGETLIDRKAAIAQLQNGLLINSSVCPGNYYAMLYGINYTIPTLLDQPMYTQSSVEVCSLLLMAVPCNLDLNSSSNPSWFIGLYATVLRNCGLQTYDPTGS